VYRRSQSGRTHACNGLFFGVIMRMNQVTVDVRGNDIFISSMDAEGMPNYVCITIHQVEGFRKMIDKAQMEIIAGRTIGKTIREPNTLNG